MTTYDERLWPPAWLWITGWLFVLSLAVSFHAVLGLAAAALIAAAGGGLLSWGLVTSAAPVRVYDGQLQAGVASIPISFLGDVQVLDEAGARAVRGPASDPAGYHLIRGWVPAGIRVDVTDHDDPAPYWFVATRHPRELAAAIEASRSD